MHDLNCRELRAIVIRAIALLALTVCGILIGAALALAVAHVLGQPGVEDQASPSGMYGFIGGIAVAQGLNLIVIVALCGQLPRRKNKRAEHDRDGSFCYKR